MKDLTSFSSSAEDQKVEKRFKMALDWSQMIKYQKISQDSEFFLDQVF